MEYETLTETITLPSGKTAVVQEFTGKSEAIITDEGLVKSGKAVTKLIHQITKEINGEKPSERTIQDLYTADRRALLLAARILTYGPEMVFDHVCSNPRCQEESEVSIRLDDEDIIVHNPMPEGLETTITLPASGHVVKLAPLTGNDELRLAKLGNTSDRLIDIALLYIKDIEGMSNARYRQFLQEASARDTQAIRKAADEVEFGPETNIEVECIYCGHKQRVELTSHVNFFFPKT